MMLYEALEKSMNHDHTDELLKDLAEARKKKKKRRDSPKMPPRSPPHQPPPPPPPAGQSHGSTTPSSSKTAASAEYKAWTTTNTRIRPSVSSTPEDLHMDYDMAPDAQAHSSDDEDIRNAHIPTVNLQQDWWKPLEEDIPATPELSWSIPSSNVPVSNNNWASALAHTSEGDRRAVGTHMWILRVVRIGVFSMYGYDYMKKIFLCRADLNEHIITERDSKYLYPSDFEDPYLLNLQDHLNHLPPKDKKILTTAVDVAILVRYTNI
nr:hypothetical protein [Tanacetum cinerariifolium]